MQSKKSYRQRDLFILYFKSCLDLIIRRTRATINSTGSSIKGPIIRASAINGLSGNDVTAIESAMGEFLAIVVRLNAALSEQLRLIILPAIRPIINVIMKNNIIGIRSKTSTSRFASSIFPCDANIAMIAKSRK